MYTLSRPRCGVTICGSKDLTFKSVDGILWCYHSNKTSSAVISHGTIYLVRNSNFWVCERNSTVLPFKWNFFGRNFAQYFLFLRILQKKGLFLPFFFLSPIIIRRERVYQHFPKDTSLDTCIKLVLNALFIKFFSLAFYQADTAPLWDVRYFSQGYHSKSKKSK